MDKMMILKVEGAKLFLKPRKDSHKMSMSNGDSVPRTDQYVECGLETLLASSVSNALHVLAGERPVPTVRKNTHPLAPFRIKELDSLAKESRVQVDSFTGNNYGEVLMTRKSYTGSTDPMGFAVNLKEPSGRAIRFFTWERFREQHDLGTFNQLISYLESTLNLKEVSSLPLLEVLLKAHRVPTIKQDLELINNGKKRKAIKKAWVDLMVKGYLPDAKIVRTGYGAKEPFMRTLVSKGVERVFIRDLTIAVPLKSSQVSLFEDGPGFATLLDGGLVRVVGVYPYSSRKIKNFKQVANPGGLSCI